VGQDPGAVKDAQPLGSAQLIVGARVAALVCARVGRLLCQTRAAVAAAAAAAAAAGAAGAVACAVCRKTRAVGAGVEGGGRLLLERRWNPSRACRLRATNPCHVTNRSPAYQRTHVTQPGT
jgi:hypothetical protein